MLSQDISKKVLTVGCDWKKPKGGVAQVLNSYATYIFNPFRFVKTMEYGSKFHKLCVFILGLFHLTIFLFSKEIKIVHVHGASYQSFWRKSIVILLSKAFGKKIVYHIHGAEYKLFAEKHKGTVRRILSNADVIIALSESWKDYFVKELLAKKVVILPNIVPFVEQRNVYSHHTNTPITAVFLGILDKRKGVYDLLSAIYTHSNELKGKFRLHIGGNSEEDKLKNYIKEHDLRDLVIFEGWVAGEKKKALLKTADLYILPSYNEGLPLSILEAMSYSMPIISTPVGGIAEIVDDDNGILVHPGDKEALYEAIMHFITNPDDIEKKGKESYERIKPYFPENVESSLNSIYMSLLH